MRWMRNAQHGGAYHHPGAERNADLATGKAHSLQVMLGATRLQTRPSGAAATGLDPVSRMLLIACLYQKPRHQRLEYVSEFNGDPFQSLEMVHIPAGQQLGQEDLCPARDVQ
jgi:hypothetical protein